MKKYVYSLALVLVGILCVTGCGSSSKVTCTYESDQSASGYKLKSEYNIYSDGDVVTKVETTETVESKNNTVLSYFEKQLKEQYKTNNEKYKGYDYKVTNKDGKVVSEVTIDYSKMDLNKFVEDNTAMKSFVNKDNKLTVKGVKSMYESIGAKCK